MIPTLDALLFTGFNPERRLPARFVFVAGRRA
jgi:hypothetical protein